MGYQPHAPVPGLRMRTPDKTSAAEPTLLRQPKPNCVALPPSLLPPPGLLHGITVYRGLIVWQPETLPDGRTDNMLLICKRIVRWRTRQNFERYPSLAQHNLMMPSLPQPHPPV